MPGDPDRPVDRGMHLVRGNRRAAAAAPARPVAVAVPVQRALAHGEHGGERRRRGRILDDAGKAFGQADRLAQPVDHPGLELGRGGRGLPQHALRGDAPRQILGDDRGRARIGREIGEEARMLPVRHARHDRAARNRRRSPPWPRHDAAAPKAADEDLAGRDLRPHRALGNGVEIIGGPIGRLVRPAAEILRVLHRRMLGQMRPRYQRGRGPPAAVALERAPELSAPA